MEKGYVPNKREDKAEEETSLQDLIEEVSPLFAHHLQDLPHYLREWVSAGILMAKTIDEIATNPEIDRNFRQLLTNRVSELGNRDDKTVENLRTHLGTVKPTKQRYGALLNNIPPVLHTTIQSFPVYVCNEIKRYTAAIAAELSDGIRKIETREQHYRYCHAVGGSIGFMVANLMGLSRYLTQEEIMGIKPDHNFESEKNPARDFGIALQLIDNIRNLHEDAAAGIQRWPAESLRRGGITYEKIAQLTARDKDELASAHKILREQIRDAQKYIIGAIDCIEVLPYEPEGLRICLGNTLANAGALSRIMDTKEFFYNEEKRIIKPEEIANIDRVVRAQTSSRMSLSPFITHLFRKEASTFVYSA